MMTKRVAFLVDGWFMRKCIYSTKAFFYNGANIRKYCLNHLKPDQELYRIFYYDSAPLDTKGHNPVSKRSVDFKKTTVYQDQIKLLEDLKRTPNVALRLGHTAWAGGAWSLRTEKLKELLQGTTTTSALTDADVFPMIEQKGVDMRFGLDIASLAYKKLVGQIVVITGDQDFVPALKLARREGIIVGLDPLWSGIAPSLREHVDYLNSYISRPGSSTSVVSITTGTTTTPAPIVPSSGSTP